ncbi:MAG: hypothetical protein U0324_21745 [Polyangiales bacterium]
MTPAPDGPDDAAMEEIVRLLRSLQLVLLKHPAASQAAFRALVHEGRRFASTPEGAAWKRRLAGSELVRQGQAVWEGVTLNMLEADTDRVFPSMLLDAFVAAAGLDALEQALARLYTGSRGGPP